MTRLAELRREQGLTQVQLATRAGVSPTTIYILESGYRPKRSWFALPAIADALGVEPETLTAREVTR